MFHLTSIANLLQALGLPTPRTAVEPNGSEQGDAFRKMLDGSSESGSETLAQPEQTLEELEKQNAGFLTAATLAGVPEQLPAPPVPSPEVPVPKVEVPEVEVPVATLRQAKPAEVKGTVPEFDTPKVEVPEVALRQAKPTEVKGTVPEFDAPKVEVPDVALRQAKPLEVKGTVPEFDTPKVEVPEVALRQAKPLEVKGTVPEFDAPKVEVPEVALRQAKPLEVKGTVPEFDTPKVEVPEVALRQAKPLEVKGTVPEFDAPKVEVPEVTLRQAKPTDVKGTVPEIDAPKVEGPEVTLRQAKPIDVKGSVPESDAPKVEGPEVTLRQAKPIDVKGSVPESDAPKVEGPEVTLRQAKPTDVKGSVPESDAPKVEGPEVTLRQAKPSAVKGSVPVVESVPEFEVPEATLRQAKPQVAKGSDPEIDAPDGAQSHARVAEAAPTRTTQDGPIGREAQTVAAGRETSIPAAAQVAGRETERLTKRTRAARVEHKSDGIDGRHVEIPRPILDWETSRAIRRLQATLDFPETREGFGHRSAEHGTPPSRTDDRPSRERPTYVDDAKTVESRESRPAVATRQDAPAATRAAVDRPAAGRGISSSRSDTVAGTAAPALEGRNVEMPAATREATRVDYRALVDSIVSRARAVPQNGSIEVRFALKPEELGQVLVRIESHGDRVKIRILAATRAAADALGAGAARLAVQMVEAGFGEPEIDLGYQAPDPQSFQRQREAAGRERRNDGEQDSRDTGNENIETQTVNPASRSASRLDRVA